MLISEANILHLRYLYKLFEEKTDSREKGELLENLIEKIAIYNGLRTFRTNKRTSYGEQIDIHIMWNRPILVECKSQEKPVELSVIEQFKHRISKREPITIGLLAAYNGFSKPAKQEITRTQDRILLILEKADIDAIILHEMDFEVLLELKIFYSQRGEIFDIQKKYEFYREWINELGSVSYKYYGRYEIQYPYDSRSYLFNYSHSSNWFGLGSVYLFPIEEKFLFDNRTEFYLVTFFRELKEPYRYPFWMESVKVYDEIFGFTENTFFGVGNKSVNWNGVGVLDFISCLQQSEKRYKNIPKNINTHHSENIAIMDLNYDRFFYLYMYSYISPPLIREFNCIMIFEDYHPYMNQIQRFASLTGQNYGIEKIKLKKGIHRENMIQKYHIEFPYHEIPVEIISELTLNSYKIEDQLGNKRNVGKEKIKYGAVVKNPLREMPHTFSEFSRLYKERDIKKLSELSTIERLLKIFIPIKSNETLQSLKKDHDIKNSLDLLEIETLRKDFNPIKFNETLQRLKEVYPHQYIFAFLQLPFRKKIKNQLFLKEINTIITKLQRGPRLILSFFRIDELDEY